MKDILILRRASQHDAIAAAGEMASWLRSRGRSPTVLDADAQLPEPLPALVVVLGGDGTVLGIARRLVGSGTPILGINFGRVGFLTAADAVQWEDCLARALDGTMPVAECLALRWRLVRGGKTIECGLAINDVVAGRGAIARLASYEIMVNGFSLGRLRCDGVIFSSPLGSTGYAASAGGSVMQSTMNVMGVTPICPFPGGVSPLVIPATDAANLRVQDTGCFLTIDGQHGQELEPEDEVIVTAQPGAVRLLGGEMRFYARLRSRFMALWGR